ncbi:MAG: mannitol dehydrogenase [Clostridia bacterium]|nr:mannitol dehydrogenase [Clostridia bacterium]
MKKAIMYGAGNIGRGFIGQLFSLSGYETVFIDINDTVVNKINADGCYPLYIAADGEYRKTEVTNVRAVNGKDVDAVAEEIATADIMATAVGVNVLKFIAAPVAAGIARRAERGGAPLNIIICENLIGADSYLRTLIEAALPEDAKGYFADSVGLVEASIGRMVPATPAELAAENPLIVCVEPYCTLPVDRAAFKGEIPDIQNLYPYAPFELFIQRKLFMHNMSHALTAYLGNLCALTYIYEAIGVDLIRDCAAAALDESARALAAEHGADLAELQAHAADLLVRYTNRLLGDPIARVGKDTKRKLSENDRLVGAYNLCRKHGIEAKHIALGIAAALRFAPEGDDSSAEIAAYTRENGVAAALQQYCGVTDAQSVALIENYYQLLSDMRNFNPKEVL